MYKFRTMHKNSHTQRASLDELNKSDGPLFKIENDPSIQDDPKMQQLITEWQRRQTGIINQCREAYKWAIKHGIAKEQARVVLPEGLTKSRLYMNGTLRSWIHFIELRSANGTQLEHQLIAIECAKVISEIFPMYK